MNKYKVNLLNVKNYEKVLMDLFDANDNKDLLLFVYNGHYHKNHMMLFHGLNEAYIKENPTVTFDVKNFFNHNIHDYNALAEIDWERYNVFFATHYIENTIQDSLSIYQSNLAQYIGINKQATIFEYHSNLKSKNSLLSQIDDISMRFALYYDFKKKC